MIEPARLYLITPRLLDVAAFLPGLRAALTAAPVDCVLLRLDPAAVRKDLAQAVALVQGAGAALLLEGEGRDAARAGADGVHVTGAGAALEAALASLKPDGIVGAGGLATRDDCMNAGEAGADYLMFGEPKADGFVPPFAATLERAQWWAELFNVPCVAYAGALEEVEPLAASGAEFVALCDAVWSDARGPAAAMADAARRLAPQSAA